MKELRNADRISSGDCVSVNGGGCFRLLYILRHLSLMMAGDEGESGEFGRRDDMEVNKGLRADVG